MKNNNSINIGNLKLKQNFDKELSASIAERSDNSWSPMMLTFYEINFGTINILLEVGALVDKKMY